MKSVIIYLFGVVVFLPWISHGYVCDSTYCSTYPCDSPKSCDNGRIIKNGGLCGCCDLCIIQIDENEECYPVALDTLPNMECGPQLTCLSDGTNNGICVPINTTCVEERTAYDQMRDSGSYVIGKHRAKCDYIGEYDSVQCITGSVCFCVNRSGKRLFGTDFEANEKSMLCNCSRDADLLRTNLEETKTFWYGRGDYQELPAFSHCLANGNYDSLQCVRENCYCLDSDLNVKSAITSISVKETLFCYDPRIHTEEYLRPCEIVRDYVIAGSYNASRFGDALIGVDIPDCDLDGTYAPVQCKENTCYCAHKNGSRMDGYEATRYSEEASRMNCYCARDRLYVDDLSHRSQIRCSALGNYEPVQCQGNLCYCVDSDGLQIGPDVHKWDLEELDNCNVTWAYNFE